MKPLGFNWKISVSLLSGMAAKEIVVSTLSVLYTGDETDEQTLGERLQADTDTEGHSLFSPLVALSLMIFVLLYFPCVATVSAIVNESGSWRWGLFVVVYTCSLAWLLHRLSNGAPLRRAISNRRRGVWLSLPLHPTHRRLLTPIA